MDKILPAQVRVTIIGGGIDGSGAACNLAKFVRTGIVML
ncbi:uncharacterized protein METZ01_LOCUS323109 [marine metagenome]|uniref:Uncharacterized protein n=1 Tax=marine metagenome TaxID=408172 RepID=A0A382PCB8_9ZZZZ